MTSRQGCSRRMVAVLCLLTMLSPSSFGQSSSAAAGKAIGADPEVVSAAQAAEEALKSAATKGEATRGATGSIGTLLTDSDTLICSAWIVSFRVQYRNMILENADPQALRAMQNLMEKVEKACEKVPSPPGAAGVVGGAGPAVVPAAAPDASQCPECDPLKQALDQRTYEYERAQYQLYQAMKRADFVDSVSKSQATPQAKRDATGGETPEQAEKAEARKRADVANAQTAMEQARAALVACLERCHRAVRKQYSMGGSKTKYVVGAGVAAAVGVVALASGGGSPSAGGAPTPTPTPAPTPGPTFALCAGTYRVQVTVSNDPAGHRRPVGMPPELVIVLTTNPAFAARSDAPWVNVAGAIQMDGSFAGMGAGVVADRPGVQVRLEGRATNCTAATGTLTGSYTMGAGGELPTGQPITYAVNGSK